MQDESCSSRGASLSRTTRAEVRAQVRVVVRIGRFHVVRRLCAAAGLPVMGLHRDAVGPVELGDLPESRHAIVVRTLCEANFFPFNVKFHELLYCSSSF